MTHFHKDTSAEVRKVLTDLHRSGQRVRLFYGDPKSGKAWPEVVDVFGRIGVDPGEIQVPILRTVDGSDKGGKIRDSSIVGILGKGGQWHYRHPSFSVGEWAVIPAPNEDYLDAVTFDGGIIELFKKIGQARRFKDFMSGRRANR
jgi:hypothetical protein